MTQKKYKLKKGLITEKFEGKIVIFDSEKSVLYNFNETASYIFKMIKKGYTLEKILNLILKKYNVKIEIAKKDLYKFINNLKNLNLIK